MGPARITDVGQAYSRRQHMPQQGPDNALHWCIFPSFYWLSMKNAAEAVPLDALNLSKGCIFHVFSTSCLSPS